MGVVEVVRGGERWDALLALADDVGQTRLVEIQFPWQTFEQTLVHVDGDGAVVGLLRWVEQPLGADSEVPAPALRGSALTEAKVIAFAVDERRRRCGIGRDLQLAAMASARTRGCHQMRSHSSGGAEANHALKLSMGFGAHPDPRDGDPRSMYFVKALVGGA